VSRTIICLLAIAAACGSPPKTNTTTSEGAPPGFDDLAALVMAHLHRLDPAKAVDLGLHAFDGELPDRSPAALAQAAAQLERDRQALAAATGLTPLQELERAALLQEVRRWLFDLVDRDLYRTSPIAYSPAINLNVYVSRDYAPLAERAGAIIKLCGGLGAYLEGARANLGSPMPRTWIDTALLQTRGYATFVDQDVRRELSAVTVPLANQADVGPALDACKRALDTHAAWLEGEQPRGTEAFALGEARFLKMLADTEGIELSLAELTRMAEADLARNTAALEEAARAIDPGRPVAEVVRELANEKPAAAEVLATATEQAAAMRAFVIERKIATIPSDDVAVVRETPPFRRWNTASIDIPGPFEAARLPAYYYITPPDPSWPPEQQRGYIPPRADLLFTTIHEVWPGHFQHFLHIHKHPSKVLQSLCTDTTVEGWAHYTEEMMFDAGAAGASPRARIGMLKKALLRNARFLVALGEHARGMSLDEARAVFEQKGFVDPAGARQQAVRGTFDPMFLSYTVGKLMIRDLAAAWMRQHPQASLGEFHDAFLSYACTPLPVIRRAMLGS
jgi:uncharacterized protein (DUF885 family)